MSSLATDEIGLPSRDDALGGPLLDLPDSILDLLPVGIYVCGRDGAIVRCNRAACELWGRTPKLGDPEERFCGSLRMHRLDGGPLPHAEYPMAEVLRSGVAARDREVVIERPDGSRTVALVNIEPITDEAGRVTGAINCFRDITERRRAEERKNLLLREMNHRVKNLFALAIGVVTLSARSARTLEDMTGAVRDRLVALARAHELTLPDLNGRSENPTGAATLHALLRTIVSPYTGPEHELVARVTLDGPDVPVGAGAVTSLALLLHELATNAAKYGALSAPTGRLDVAWSVVEERLLLTWTERGGPRLSGPAEHEGFGTRLARGTVTGQMGGEIDSDWNPEGLTVRLSLSLERLAA